MSLLMNVLQVPFMGILVAQFLRQMLSSHASAMGLTEFLIMAFVLQSLPIILTFTLFICIHVRHIVVAVDFHINLDVQIDQGYVLDVPKEISISCGPRKVDDTWWAHFCTFMDFEPETQAPWAQRGR